MQTFKATALWKIITSKNIYKLIYEFMGNSRINGRYQMEFSKFKVEADVAQSSIFVRSCN